MLEKNKDYVEFTLQYTSVDWSRHSVHPEVSLNGYSDFDFPGVPIMDVVCKEFDHKVVVVGKRDFDRLQANVNINAELAKQWEINYDLLLKKTGFDTVESLVFYLNQVGQDTLLNTLASYISEGDKALKECEVMKKKLEECEKENADLYAEIRKWKDMTKCETPEAAATWITSYESACGRGNRLAEMVEKLKEEVVSWKNVTGYSTPEDYMQARISGTFHTPFNYTAAWQKATGCDTPDQAKSHIKDLEDGIRLMNKNMLKELDNEIDEWQKFTGCDSPQAAGCKINNLCDEICKLKGDYDRLLKLTGYKSKDGICVALNYSEQFVYETMRELINSLKRKAKFTESNWQAATGCDAPEKAQCKITDLYNRINKMKEAASIASNWTDKIVEG